MRRWLAHCQGVQCRSSCKRVRPLFVLLFAFQAARLVLVFEGAGSKAGVVTAAEQVSKSSESVTADVHEAFAEVRRVLDDHCFACHGAEVQQAGLDLSSWAGVARGGESGPVVRWGDADASELVQRVRTGEMPPEGETPLTLDERALLERWVLESAEPAAAIANSADVGPDASAHEGSPQSAVHGPRGDADEEPTQSQAAALMVLRRHCIPCHGRHRQEAGLDLRTRASILRGGKSGAAMVPGQPEESRVVHQLRAGQMPPRERLIEASVKPVDPAAVELIAAWIAAGAPEVVERPDVATEAGDRLVTDKDRDFWSFRAPSRPSPPQVRSISSRVRNPIDAFILEGLREEGLEFAPEADRVTLIRRVTFDVTGLPPTPEEVRAFLDDPRPDAYEHLVDRLLASPRHGERWARFWLDLAGYADSEGKREQDLERPHAWRYRDYVIRALNFDKPYDRFLHEQLAGDELADYTRGPEVTAEVHDNLVATAFLRMVPDATWANITGFLPDRVEVIAEEIDVLGAAVFGLTLKCARCHTHKLDPIPQRDYYRLVDVFKGALDEYDWMKPDIPRVSPAMSRDVVGGRHLPQVPAQELAAWREKEGQLTRQIEGLQQRLQTLEQGGPGDANASAATEEMERLKAEIQQLESRRQPEPRVQALWDRGQPSPTYIYRRGDPFSPGRLVGPGVPSVLTDGRTPFEVQTPWPGAPSTGRRLALARWLTQADHPLTARVQVNRLWRYHFGAGIVRTLDNFGRAGAPPTHSGLLDWLATEFVRRGWSQKEMHRLMLTSSTYRQVAQPSSEAVRIDPANQLLSRMPLVRLNAEALYDAQLFVAGALVDRPHGPADWVSETPEGLATPSTRRGGWRRLVYVQQRRKQIVTFRETFDFPQMNPNCVDRRDSIVAPQALYLMNNGQVWTLAERFAARVRAEAGEEPKGQVERAVWLAWGRSPTEQERDAMLEAMRGARADDQSLAATSPSEASTTDDPPTAEPAVAPLDPPPMDPELDPLVAICHALLNSAAFSHLD